VSEPDLTGRLLIATPRIRDGIFDRSVVFVLQHDDSGAAGVVLNRPSEVLVFSVLPRWDDAATPPAVVFTGGPVADRQLLGVARFRPDPLTGALTVGTVNLDVDPDPTRVAAVRVFAGYAGWSAGQLEDEVVAGGWYVVPAEADDPFTTDPGGLWRQVLRRQPGQLAVLSTYPDDPRMN
jgi:putative transcriptional regulator